MNLPPLKNPETRKPGNRQPNRRTFPQCIASKAAPLLGFRVSWVFYLSRVLWFPEGAHFPFMVFAAWSLR